MIDLLRLGQPHEVQALVAVARRMIGPDVRVVDRDRIGRDHAPILPWLRRPGSVAPVPEAVACRLRGRRARWLDLDGSHGPCGPKFLLVEGARYLAFRALDCIARVLAELVAAVPPARPREAGSGGRLQVVLPVASDLSHTFVYREAVRLVERDADAELVVLERGLPDAPRHRESDAVAALATVVPQPGLLRRYAQVLRWLGFHPRRASRMLRLYRRDPRGIGGLFGKLPCREPRHPGNAFAFASFLARRPPGPLHVYGSTYSANVVMGASLLLDRPYSITSYVDFEFDYDHRMLDAKYATSRFFRVCTAYCRQRILELVPGAEPDRVPVVLFGLDLGAWSEAARPEGRGVLFSACRLVPKKGLHLLPPAIAALRTRGIRCEWRVAGDGPERARLEALVAEHGVEDRVVFLGSVTTDVVRAELRRADLAVLPCVVAADGERDGIPIFFTEAMALGVPVLTTPISGIPELVEDGVTGFLVPPDDTAALAERLADVLVDDALRAAVAARGREVVHAKLDLDDAVQELLGMVRAP